jgi:hypothetical protein
MERAKRLRGIGQEAKRQENAMQNKMDRQR